MICSETSEFELRDFHWLKLTSSRNFIETHERWVTATWLESSSLEQQRGMANETDRDRHRLDEVD